MKCKIRLSVSISCIILLIICVVWLGFTTYKSICNWKKLNDLQQEVNNIKQDILYLDEEYKNIWLNIDALSENYTLLFNEIYRSDDNGR